MADVGESPLLVRNRRDRTCSINDPELDVANESGNMAFDIPIEGEDQRAAELNRRKLWQLNYQEAAIFLQEGENNDKFYTHPRNHEALPAYQVAHNRWFYLLDLSAAILLLLLALCERPAVSYFSLPVGVHASLELLGLLLLSLELGIRLKWLGPRIFFRHVRTDIKCLALAIMLIEAVTTIVRQKNHIRVTRALRPLFLFHSYYCQGVRRITRQILQSLPPILDMIGLLLFFMLIFSILGFYLFASIPNFEYFKDIQTCFISLFVLLTTANFPDVMMPAYRVSRWYSLFFIVYLSLELYFMMNLLLAVVYDTFSNLEKKKLRSLFFHKREACRHAFRLLVTKHSADKLSVRHFCGMMKYFVPGKSRRDYYLMFKWLNVSKSGGLSLEEFFDVHNACALKWQQKNEERLWSTNFKHPCNLVFKGLHWFVNWKWFDYFIYLVIAANFLWILIETIEISSSSQDVRSFDFTTSWTSIVFVCIYSVEAALKILGKGPMEYFTSGWDVFDFLVTVVSVVGVLGELFADSFYYIIVLRPFRLLRLFKIKRRYRDVLGTLFVLFSRLTSLAIVILLVYYFFAIIGMEVFLDVNLRNCCQNTSVADQYRADNTSFFLGYYLNNFDNILVAGVTLFELTVVNNWFIIMEGYASAMSEWTRIYFMSFYIVMMVVMNIVVAFVLESFLFRIQYRRQMKLDNIDDDEVYRTDISLTDEEMHMTRSEATPLTGQYIAQEQESEACYVFRGEKPRSREDFSLRMYKDEVQGWIEEEREVRRKVITSMVEMRQRERPNSGLTDLASPDTLSGSPQSGHLTLDLSPDLSPDLPNDFLEGGSIDC